MSMLNEAVGNFMTYQAGTKIIFFTGPGHSPGDGTRLSGEYVNFESPMGGYVAFVINNRVFESIDVDMKGPLDRRIPVAIRKWLSRLVSKEDYNEAEGEFYSALNAVRLRLNESTSLKFSDYLNESSSLKKGDRVEIGTWFPMSDTYDFKSGHRGYGTVISVERGSILIKNAQGETERVDHEMVRKQ